MITRENRLILRARIAVATLLLPTVAILLLTAVAMPVTAVTAAPVTRQIRGIALAEIHPGHGLDPFLDALDEIQRLGAEWVLLPVHGYVDSAAAPLVDMEWEPPVDMASYQRFTGSIARAARERGLSVALIPYINLREGGVRDWRGTLRPPDWPAWFVSYERFLQGWVEVARSERISILGVGAELVSSELHRQEWQSLIRRVRADYHGRILYSCNWDHYRETPFLPLLDMVGLSGYYSLPHEAPLTEASISELWLEVRAELLTWQKEIDRPFLFTEIGYPSIQGAARDPWNYQMEGPPDVAGQARALSAFSSAWRGQPELLGVFFWNWSPFRGGSNDRSYSIREKPAAGVIRRWFLGSEP